MVYIVIFVVILFLPLYFNVYLYNSIKDKRFYFALYLFGFLKILDGFITKRAEGGFYIHYRKNKAIVIDNDLVKLIEGNSFNFFSLILIKYLYLSLDIGIKNPNLTIILMNLFTHYINLGKYIEYNYPYYKSNVNLNVFSVNKNYISIKIKLTFCLNIFCIVKALITNIISRGVKSAKKYAKTWKCNIKSNR